MAEVAFDLVLAVVSIVLAGYLTLAGWRRIRRGRPGWYAIILGFLLLALGGILGAAGQFGGLDRYLMAGGGVLIAAGLFHWVPMVMRLLDRTREANGAYAKRALAISEREFRDLYYRTPAMMHSINANREIIEVSDFWLESLGYTRDEVIGKPILDFVSEESRELALNTNFPRFFEAGSSRDLPYQVIKKDGTKIDVLLSAVAVMDDDGNFVRSLTVMNDVTERNRAEAEAKRSWERLVDAVESIDHGFCLWGTDDRLMIANSRYIELFPEECRIAKPGMTFEEILRPLLRTGFIAQYKDDTEEYVQARVAEHRRCERNIERVLPDGRWIRLSEYRTKHGEIVGLRTDITDLKKRQAELAAGEQRFRDFASASVDRFWETDADDRIIYISEPTGRLNMPSEDICGKKIWTEDRPEIWESNWEEVERAMAAREPFREFRSTERRADGSVLHARMSGTPWYDENGTFMGYRGGVTDATAEIEAVERAANIQKRFLDAIEGISDGFVLWDAEDRFVMCNGHFRDRAPAAVAEVLVPGTKYCDYLYRRASAGEVPEAVGREDEWVAEHLSIRDQPIHETFARGRWFQVRCQRLDDGSMFEFHTDVTDIKSREAELERAKIGAEAASRAKSDFLSSVSHEMRTPMNAILGFGQLLAESTKTGDPVMRRQVNQILRGGRHLLRLIDEVLDLAKIEAGTISVSPEPVPPAGVIEECLSMVADRAQEFRVTLEHVCDGSELPDLWVDRVRFRQILLNLLTNAVKYNRPGGKVVLSQQDMGNGMVRISVADTGQGIPEDLQAELFKPFNRLGRETGEVEGTGIGLAITRSLVELSGGHIGFESEPDVGSTFWVDLPVAKAGAKSRTRSIIGRRPVPAPHGSARQLVLYAEDNPANLDLMAEIVAQFPNTELVCVRDGESAVEIAAERHPDLILLDINLPGIDGFEALERIKSDPGTRNTPVMALTAAAMPADVKRGVEAGFTRYLTKPIDLSEVYEILSACDSVDF